MDDLRKELAKMQEKLAKIPGELRRIARDATMAAVDKATELTPPRAGDIRGTGTITGALKAHWATDTKADPVVAGDEYLTTLKNDMEYASYVNDGHRLDRHFVPGLMVNPYSGLIERVPPEVGGMVVGTKTAYIPGLFMADEAEKVYSEAAEAAVEASEVFNLDV